MEYNYPSQICKHLLHFVVLLLHCSHILCNFVRKTRGNPDDDIKVRARWNSPGGRLHIQMPGCVCWVSENAPILNDTSSCKNIPILNGFSAQFIPNFKGNIKIQVLTYTYHLLLLISYQFCLYSHCCSSALALLHPFSYNTSQKSYAHGMGQQISHPYWMKYSHSFHSLEAKKGLISFTFRHTHPGIRLISIRPPLGEIQILTFVILRALFVMIK